MGLGPACAAQGNNATLVEEPSGPPAAGPSIDGSSCRPVPVCTCQRAACSLPKAPRLGGKHQRGSTRVRYCSVGPWLSGVQKPICAASGSSALAAAESLVPAVAAWPIGASQLVSRRARLGAEPTATAASRRWISRAPGRSRSSESRSRRERSGLAANVSAATSSCAARSTSASGRRPVPSGSTVRQCGRDSYSSFITTDRLLVGSLSKATIARSCFVVSLPLPSAISRDSSCHSSSEPTTGCRPAGAIFAPLPGSARIARRERSASSAAPGQHRPFRTAPARPATKSDVLSLIRSVTL